MLGRVAGYKPTTYYVKNMKEIMNFTHLEDANGGIKHSIAWNCLIRPS
jgi:hypothetical protein